MAHSRVDTYPFPPASAHCMGRHPVSSNARACFESKVRFSRLRVHKHVASHQECIAPVGYVFSCPVHEADCRCCRLGRQERKMFSLWSDELAAIPSTPLAARELDDAFAEGMTFLQQYPLESAGGIEAVVQCACDLAQQHQELQQGARASSTSFGARLRDTVWGFAHVAPVAESSEEHTDSETSDEETEHEAHPNGQPNTFTARLANSVWRGISNESAMEAPPSPTTPTSPMPPSPVQSPLPRPLPPPPSEMPEGGNPSAGPSKFWGYAEKLKDSDAAATLAKVSTNWRVKALDVWNKRASNATFLSPPPTAPLLRTPDMDGRRASLNDDYSRSPSEKRRGGSLPGLPPHLDGYSPPSRPAFFKPPRDSVMFTGGRSPLSPSNGEMSPASDTGSIGSGGIRASLASFGMQQDQSKAARTRSGPRPLLLNSASLMTNRSPNNTPLSGSSDKSMDNVRGMRTSPAQRDSTSSSYSSFSPVHSRSATMDSDTGGSRIVPLRSSRSPMARGSRRVTPTSSTTSSPPKLHRRMDTDTSTHLGSDDGGSSRGWRGVDISDSPPTGPSPPPPQTPADATSGLNRGVRVKGSTSRTASPSVVEAGDVSSDMDSQPVKSVYPLPRLSVGDDTSDSSATQAPQRSPRSKQKRIPPKLSTNRSKENIMAENGLAGNTLSTGWSEDEDVDNVTTPRAMTFQGDNPVSNSATPRNVRRVRKTSGDGNGEARPRKLSGDGGRVRKISTDGSSPRRRKLSGEREVTKHKRESSADEGDDEGYRDLLSAYESED